MTPANKPIEWPIDSGWEAHERAYLIARAEAAIQRLRRLREAMLEIRSVHPLMHNGGNWDKFVDEALALCDLPEESQGNV